MLSVQRVGIVLLLASLIVKIGVADLTNGVMGYGDFNRRTGGDKNTYVLTEMLDFENSLGSWEVIRTGSPSHGISTDYAYSGIHSYKAGPSNCGVNCFDDHMVTLQRTLDGTRIFQVTFFLYEEGCWGGKCRIKINGIEVGNWNPRPNTCPPQPGWVECTWSGDTICYTLEIQAWDLTNRDALYIDDITIYSEGWGPRRIYIDDDAPNDPNPYNPTTSDPDEDGSQEHPFDMIQEGIDAAIDRDIVVVLDGTYWEMIDFKGKSIKVTGQQINNSMEEIFEYPVIDAGYQGPVVTFSQGEDPNTILSGFVIARGEHEIGSGIYCVGSHPQISNCLITCNRTSNDDIGSAIYCLDSNSVFKNLTVAYNDNGSLGTSLAAYDCNLTITNSIFWHNDAEQIRVESGNDPVVTYSDIQGGWPGNGNIDKDPCFVSGAAYAGFVIPGGGTEMSCMPGDYHLKSRAGHWDSMNTWIIDDSTSPCIDAGDPDSPWQNEPEPSGGRINLGAYGGTAQASMTSPECCLTITATEGGRVIEPGLVEPGQTRTFCFECGEIVTIVVETDPNYYFIGWGPGAGGRVDSVDPNGLTFTVVVDSDIELDTVYTSIGSGQGGSVEFPDGPPSESTYGTYVRIVAQPAPCYHFVGWTGTAVDADKVTDPSSADTTVYVDGNYTLIANFAPDTPTLTLSSSAGGSITLPGEGPFVFDCNEAVNVLAVPESCYHFVNWTGTAVDAGKVDNPNDPNTTVTVDADYTLIANFAINVYQLTLSSTGCGTTIPGEGVHTFDCNAVVPITAVPDSCCHFTGWTGTAVDAGQVEDPNDPNTTVTIDADYALIAHFALIESTLSISSTDGGSVVTPGEGDFTYDCGTSVQLEVEAEPCYRFSHWTGTAIDANVADPCDPNLTVVVKEDCTVKAHFVKIEYDLTISSSEHGSVTLPGEGTFTYECGTSVPIEATPDEYCYFIGWAGTAVDEGKVANPNDPKTTVTIDGDYTLHANFAIYQHTVQFTSTEGGYVNLTSDDTNISISWLHPRTLQFDHGTEITFLAVAKPGYRFSHWSGTHFSTVDYLFFSVEQDHNITANFVPIEDES